MHTRILQLVLFGTLGAIGWLLVTGGPQSAADQDPSGKAPPTPTPASSTPAGSKDVASRRAASPVGAAPSKTMPDEVSEFARAWDALDLVEVRTAMPDNLIWQLAAPTKDPAILNARQEQRQYWEQLYGKVYSNTASVKEVNEYYAHQQQRSADYIEFTSYIIDNHSEDLRDQDLTLLHLARRMHTARLQEIPKRQADALARREAHAKAREAWLANKKRASTEASTSNEEQE